MSDTVPVDQFSSEKTRSSHIASSPRMLRQYVVMKPLYEHAHTGLFFGRVRLLRIYVFDLRACFASIHLRGCLSRYQ